MMSSTHVATVLSSDKQSLKSEPTFKYQATRLFGMNAAGATESPHASLKWMPTPLDH
jgi:hypothetical protein